MLGLLLMILGIWGRSTRISRIHDHVEVFSPARAGRDIFSKGIRGFPTFRLMSQTYERIKNGENRRRKTHHWSSQEPRRHNPTFSQAHLPWSCSSSAAVQTRPSTAELWISCDFRSPHLGRRLLFEALVPVRSRRPGSLRGCCPWARRKEDYLPCIVDKQRPSLIRCRGCQWADMGTRQEWAGSSD